MLFSRRKRALRRMKAMADLGDVPAFPRSVTRVLDALRDPESSLAEIAEAISWDPGLVMRLLRTVNSAAFGLRRQVDSCRHAVSFLGRANLESLLLGLAIEGALPPGKAPGYDPARFWRGSARRAALARLVAERLEPTRQAESFAVGLLQDLAIPVLAHARPDEYGPVLAQWRSSPGERLDELERRTFGWCHAELGATIADAWELPESLVEGIRNHHAEKDAVHAAVHLVALLPESDSLEAVDSLIETARSSYGLVPDWTRRALQRSGEQASELVELMQ